MKSSRPDSRELARWLLPALLCVPLPVLAQSHDPAGMLTVFVGLPVLGAAVLLLGLLIAVPALLTGAYVACVDTWRFWPDPGAADAQIQITIVMGCALLWTCLLGLAWLMWKGASRPPLQPIPGGSAARR